MKISITAHFGVLLFLTPTLLPPSSAMGFTFPGGFEATATLNSNVGFEHLDFAPNGALWYAKMYDRSILDFYRVTSTDNTFINGDEHIEHLPNSTVPGNGFFFYNSDLYCYDTSQTNHPMQKHEAVDGVFFNGDDRVTDVNWEVRRNTGLMMPLFARIGPDGKLYSSDYSNMLGIYDIATGTYSEVDLDARFGIAHRFGDFSFDPSGNLWIDDWENRMLYGIDPVDGLLFNGNDILHSYSTQGFRGVSTDARFCGLVFDPDGNMIVSMYNYYSPSGFARLSPLTGGDGIPPVPEPASVALLGLGITGLIGWRARRGQKRQQRDG